MKRQERFRFYVFCRGDGRHDGRAAEGTIPGGNVRIGGGLGGTCLTLDRQVFGGVFLGGAGGAIDGFGDLKGVLVDGNGNLWSAQIEPFLEGEDGELFLCPADPNAVDLEDDQRDPQNAAFQPSFAANKFPDDCPN